MIREIQAKTLLSSTKQPDDFFGLKYNMNLYRGCIHRCVYCDSRSECYQIEDFDGEVLVKANAIELLRDELSRKQVKGTIGLGSMTDPFMPIEAEINLAGRALAVIAEFGFPVHIITKSALVLKDLETLRQIAQTYAAISFTVTTATTRWRPARTGRLSPSARFAAMKYWPKRHPHRRDHDAHSSFIEDTEENLAAIVGQAVASGATYVLPWIGMSLRDRQRDYYYAQLDRLFPGLRQKYERTYGERYSCEAPNARALYRFVEKQCAQHGLALRMPRYAPQTVQQLSLF
jgi:hypothetical protein